MQLSQEAEPPSLQEEGFRKRSLRGRGCAPGGGRRGGEGKGRGGDQPQGAEGREGEGKSLPI